MINYKAVQKKNPSTKEVKYYPGIVLGNPMLLEELTENIALNCTVTEHDIKAVLSALQEQVILALKQGRSVRMGDLGSFRPTMTGTGEATPEEVDETNITGLRVQFTKSARMDAELQIKARGISFRKVSSGAAEGE